jgi:AraC-like DNA-binding protein
VTATRLTLPPDLEFTAEGRSDFVINELLDGTISHDRGPTADRCQPGDVYLSTHPGASFRSTARQASVLAITLPAALIQRVAGSAPQPPRPAGPVRFTAARPDPGAAGRWRHTARFVAGLLANPDTAAQPLIHGPAARLLAATALTVIPNSTLTDPTIEDRHDAHPATLRRAIAFIDDNAHRDLLAADPERATVTAVAYRWGFGSSSRFAAAYRRAYGTTPNQTLRNR